MILSVKCAGAVMSLDYCWWPTMFGHMARWEQQALSHGKSLSAHTVPASHCRLNYSQHRWSGILLCIIPQLAQTGRRIFNHRNLQTVSLFTFDSLTQFFFYSLDKLCIQVSFLTFTHRTQTLALLPTL